MAEHSAENDALRNALGTDQDDVFGDLALTIARAVEGQVASAVNGFGADLVRVERCYSHGIARAALTALRAHVIPPGTGDADA